MKNQEDYTNNIYSVGKSEIQRRSMMTVAYFNHLLARKRFQTCSICRWDFHYGKEITSEEIHHSHFQQKLHKIFQTEVAKLLARMAQRHRVSLGIPMKPLLTLFSQFIYWNFPQVPCSEYNPGNEYHDQDSLLHGHEIQHTRKPNTQSLSPSTLVFIWF